MAQRKAGDTGLLVGRRGSNERLPASWMLTASVLSRNDAHTCSPLAGSGWIRHPINWLFLPFSSLLNNNLFFPLTAYVLFFHLIETVKGIRWRLNLSASLSMLMCIEQAPLLSKPSLSKGTQEFFPSKEIFSPSDLSFPSCHHYSAVQIFQLLPHPLLLSKTKFLGNNIYTSWLHLINLPCTTNPLNFSLSNNRSNALVKGNMTSTLTNSWNVVLSSSNSTVQQHLAQSIIFSIFKPSILTDTMDSWFSSYLAGYSVSAFLDSSLFCQLSKCGYLPRLSSLFPIFSP